MKKKKITSDYLKKNFPRCCLLSNPLTVKTYNKMAGEYGEKVLMNRLRLVEMFLQYEDFFSIEITVKSIVFYIGLYADGEL